MKKLLSVALLSLLASTAANATSKVMCHFYSMDIQSSQMTYPVKSDHTVYIVNQTNKVQTYYIVYQQRIDGNIVHNFNIDVRLYPGQIYRNEKTEIANLKFSQKGNHDASCGTFVLGDERNNIMGGGKIIVR